MDGYLSYLIEKYVSKTANSKELDDLANFIKSDKFRSQILEEISSRIKDVDVVTEMDSLIGQQIYSRLKAIIENKN